MTKTALLLLHGAVGGSSQLGALAKALSVSYEVHLLDFPGHGGKAFPQEAFSIGLFADAALAYIRARELKEVVLWGYSMGGYVAMYLARHHPELVRGVITLGTKFHWDSATAAREVNMLQADKIAVKLPAFAASLAAIHVPNDWKEVMQRTAIMLMAMGEANPLQLEDYKEISIPVLLLLGDRDKMVTLEETVAVYQALPAARMAVLPGTPHPIDQVDPGMLVYFTQQK